MRSMGCTCSLGVEGVADHHDQGGGENEAVTEMNVAPGMYLILFTLALTTTTTVTAESGQDHQPALAACSLYIRWGSIQPLACDYKYLVGRRGVSDYELGHEQRNAMRDAK